MRQESSEVSASSCANRWTGVCCTALITLVWSDLLYYGSLEQLQLSGFGEWYSAGSMLARHALCAFVLLDLCSLCHVRDAAGLFLASSVSGLLSTGVLTTSLFDSVPVSVAWRCLFWYSISGVFGGLWCVRSALHWPRSRVWLLVGCISVCSLTWVCWSGFWIHSLYHRSDLIRPQLWSVSLFLWGAFALLFLAYFTLDMLYKVRIFDPSWLERTAVVAALLSAAVYQACQRAGYLVMFALVLCPVLSLCVLSLVRYRRISLKVRSSVWNALSVNRESNEDEQILSHFSLVYRDIVSHLSDNLAEQTHHWLLVVFPSLSTVLYGCLVGGHSTVLLATLVYVSGVVIGFGALAWALWRVVTLNERAFLRQQYAFHPPDSSLDLIDDDLLVDAHTLHQLELLSEPKHGHSLVTDAN